MAGARLLGVILMLCLGLCAVAANAADGGISPTALVPAGEVSLDEFPAWLRERVKGLEWAVHTREKRLTRNILQQSLALGGQFLISNQRPAGNFNYEYDLVTRRLSRGDSQVRQAGALWGIALLFQHQQDAATRAALEHGLKFFFDRTVPGRGKGALMIAYPDQVECQTGTVALVALSIIEYLRTEKAEHVVLSTADRGKLQSYLDGYLAHLQDMQLEDKHFAETCILRNRERATRSSPYFDGEAMLCLIKAAKYLDRRDLVPLIESTAMVLAKDYTVDEWLRDPDSRQTKGFFQWSCMAFWEYQDAGWRQAEAFADYALVMSWWMIHTHHTLRRTRNTAYACEGMVPGLRVARARGDKDAIHDIEHTLDLTLLKLTSWQVGGPLQWANAFLSQRATRDQLAIGGVMNHAAEAPLRIDVTQHQMHAVIMMLDHVYADQVGGAD